MGGKFKTNKTAAAATAASASSLRHIPQPHSSKQMTIIQPPTWIIMGW
jgi:hypothetical protein